MSAVMPMKLEGVDVTLLPPQIKLLVQTIGMAQTVVLLQAHGGERIEIAHSPTNASLLKTTLDHEALTALCARFGGTRPTLPKADKVLTQLRNQAIIAERGQTSKRELARRYKLTCRQIQYIWNSQEETNSTGDMFL